MKMLAGEETPDIGEIHWKKGASIGYLTQTRDYDDHTTPKDVFRSAVTPLLQMEERMKQLETEMEVEPNSDILQKLLNEYGNIQDQFTMYGGYEIEANIENIARGLNVQNLLDLLFPIEWRRENEGWIRADAIKTA